MKSQNRLAVVFLVVIIIAAYFEVKGQLDRFGGYKDNFFLINLILAIPLKFIWIGAGVFSLIKWKKKKGRVFLIPFCFSIGLLITVIIIRSEFYKRESSSVVLKGIFKGELHRITVSLRENRTYKLEDYGMYWGLTRFGEYEIHSDTIILSNDYDFGEENDFRSRKLLRKGDFLIPFQDKNGAIREDTLSRLKVFD